MNRKIVGFHQDEEQHWVAELECGHNQHVRHDPPWTNRPWVITPEGRAAMLGQVLACRKCDRSPDEQASNPFVERTSSGRLRLPTAAARIQRQATKDA